jgi:hypothetical protein
MKTEAKNAAAVSISVLLVVLALVSLMPMASAEVEMTSDTDYTGGQEDSDQVVEIGVTLSPVGNPITNATVRIDSASESFVDYGTFSVSVDPAGVEGRVSSLGNGEFEITELNEGEQVTFSYEAYPRKIKAEALSVSSVDVQYVQRGQDLSNTHVVEANLSSSPWFRLQQTQQELDDARSSIWINRWVLIVGIILAIIGVIVAVVAIKGNGGGGLST